MNFIELKASNGGRFMIDFDSGWEVWDKGLDPALWTNHVQARNLDCGERYLHLREKLLPAQPSIGGADGDK